LALDGKLADRRDNLRRWRVEHDMRGMVGAQNMGWIIACQSGGARDGSRFEEATWVS
jgi:hypothetical protein